MFFDKAGDIEHPHTHAFDHITLLTKGSLRVTVDGKQTVFEAPHMIFIKAEKMHELVAMVDGTIAHCIHALRDKNGDILDPSMIPSGIDPMSTAAKILA